MKKKVKKAATAEKIEQELTKNFLKYEPPKKK